MNRLASILPAEQVLVTVDAITLSENPDLSPGNPGMTGAAVAVANGPWAVDLAKEGPVDAKEMEARRIAEKFRFEYANNPAAEQAIPWRLDEWMSDSSGLASWAGPWRSIC